MKKFVALFLLMTAAKTFAVTGQDIITMVRDHNKGFKSEENEMTLIIKENSSVTAERKLRGKIIEFDLAQNGLKSLIEFMHPSDVKGTKLLTWLKDGEDKSQWIYLPSLNKSKRILSSNSNSSFMGSEFSYNDIGGEQIDKNTYKLLNETKNGNDLIWSIEQRPKDTNEKEYKVIFVKKSLMAVERAEYFNAKGEKYKEATMSDFKKYSIPGKTIFRYSTITMKNLINKNESVITWSKRDFGSDVAEKEFGPQMLEMKR